MIQVNENFYFPRALRNNSLSFFHKKRPKNKSFPLLQLFQCFPKCLIWLNFLKVFGKVSPQICPFSGKINENEKEKNFFSKIVF